MNAARLYCPEKDLPLHVDAWIFLASHPTSATLPRNARESGQMIEALRSRFFFICTDYWTVSNTSGQVGKSVSSRSVQMMVTKTEGWSICFSDSAVKVSYGALMQSLAVQMAREASKRKREAKRPGRKSKVQPLAEHIGRLHPDGIEGLQAKQIARTLNQAGVTNFGHTTLRTAMSLIKGE